jgi:hypothetical protein
MISPNCQVKVSDLWSCLFYPYNSSRVGAVCSKHMCIDEKSLCKIQVMQFNSCLNESNQELAIFPLDNYQWNKY